MKVALLPFLFSHGARVPGGGGGQHLKRTLAAVLHVKGLEALARDEKNALPIPVYTMITAVSKTKA